MPLKKHLTKFTLIFLILVLFLVPGCNAEPKHSMSEAEKEKMIETMMQVYKAQGGAITREQAEKYVEDYEQAREQYGDSMTYFNGVLVGFGKPISGNSSSDK